MNEKIRLFASRVGSLGDHLWLDGRDPDEEAAVEKFAELIVRECATVSENYATGSMPLSISLAIKKHFGIEE